MDRFSAAVEQKLRESGWFPFRTVTQEDMEKWLIINCAILDNNIQLRMFPEAYCILQEFGKLKIEQDAPGISCYRHTITFDPYGILLDSNWIEAWFYNEWVVGMHFPLGYIGDKEQLFSVDIFGRIIDAEEFLLFGETIDEAMENFIRGIAAKPLDYNKDKARQASQLLPAMERKLGLL